MRAILLAAAFACLALAGCSSSPADNPVGDQNATVTIKDFNFNPTTVNVHEGSSVEWTNSGAVGHTVTFDDGSYDSGTIDAGHKADHQFGKAGTYTYKCKIHPTMTGTITVSAK